MKNPLMNMRKEAYKLALTREEKRAMHANLMARVRSSSNMAPARSRPSPYFFAPQFSMAMAALLLVVLVGSGTAYAAKGALPGDMLYTIKVKVNEPIEGALAFSTEDKIQFNSGVVQTRLEEAEVLASQNRLGATVSAELASSIDTHLSDRDALAQTLDKQDPGAGTQTIARLDASLNAHSDILVALGSEASSSVRDHSDSIAMSARGSRHNFGSGSPVLAMAAKVAVPTAPSQNAPHPMMMAFSVSEGSTSSSSDQVASDTPKQDSHHSSNSKQDSSKNSSQKIAAQALGSRATSTLASLRAKVAAMKDKTDSDTQTLLDQRFADIDSLIAQGNGSLSQGDYSDASNSFNDALDHETTLSAFISAGVQFDGGILKNLLGHNSHWGEDQ